MTITFGTLESPSNIVIFRNVRRFYLSIAPKNNKYQYIRFESIDFVITNDSEIGNENMLVYVVDFFDMDSVVLIKNDYLLNKVG